MHLYRPSRPTWRTWSGRLALARPSDVRGFRVDRYIACLYDNSCFII